MYTLINGPVLGFDLSRRSGGHLVAELVVRVLSLDDTGIALLAAAHSDDAARDAAWLEISAEEHTNLAQGLRIAADRLTGGAPTEAVLHSLERLALGDLDGLLRFVRHELLDWTWTAGGTVQSPEAAAAGAVICDAAASAYAAERLSAPARRRLAAPWLAACREMSEPAVDLGPQGPTVSALLARVAVLSPAQVSELLRVVTAARPELAGWASAMHEATWAVELSGRARSAAAAQMLLVDALSGTVGSGVSARGAWNVLSGLVQALVVGDLVESAAIERLVPGALRSLPWVGDLDGCFDIE